MPRGALKSSVLLAGTLGMTRSPKDLAPPPMAMSMRSSTDLESIVQIVRRWAKAWSEGDLETLSACLHPDLLPPIPGMERTALREALKHAVGIQSVLGRATSLMPHLRAEVWVLDIQGDCGSARVDLGPWTAFMHLAAHKEGWAISKVLWEWTR